MPEPRDLTPAEHVVPPPADGWRAADLSDDERVDDAFIAANSGRTYAPLQPADEKLFPPEAPRGS
jgi:hypothetical protein